MSLPLVRHGGRAGRRILPDCGAVVIVLIAPGVQAQVVIDSFAGFDITLEGLVQADANWYDSDVADLDGDTGDGDDADYALRTAQFYLRGKGKGNIDWVLGYDAKADKWLDANTRYRFGDGGRQFVQLGQFKQPNGLEELSAAKHADFMSLAMISNTFAVGRRLGMAYSIGHPYDRTSGQDGGYQRHGDWGITASWFGRELTRDLGRGSGYGIRGTWALMNAERRIFHVGLSYVDHDTPADTLRLRARPNADLTPVRLVDTGSMTDTDRVSTLGAESFWVHGPLKLQAEYMSTRVDRMASPDFNGRGGYFSALWNVTGQTWSYKGGEPATQVGEAAGAGTWQLGLRYDVMDLDDGAVAGGRMNTWTAGVNWYWRKHLKVVFNHVHVDSERVGIDDDPGITEARVQLYW